MHDTLSNGKTLRTSNIIDDFNREVLSIIVDTSLPSQRVIRELETLAEWRGILDTICSDYGTEFIS
jgi:putative transposase